MTKTQERKLRQLNDWQVRQIENACQAVAAEQRKADKTNNSAFLSFLYVFASALVLLNTASLKAFHAAFALLNRRALAGDDEAAEVVKKLSLVLQDAASIEILQEKQKEA